MSLVDAGPLIALLDADEHDHERCVRVLTTLRPPLETTWPALTEAMHLLGRVGGLRAQGALWSLVLDGRLRLLELDEPVIRRAAELMQTYADLPMDLADATLVAAAEARDDPHIFTLDRDFLVYRLHGRRPFVIVPN